MAAIASMRRFMASSSRKAQLRLVHPTNEAASTPFRFDRFGALLVIALLPAYRAHVRYLRALTLVCFAFGLFVQVAAQASAMPPMKAADTMDCAGMAHSGHDEAREEPSDRRDACHMTLDCLIAMNCIAPIALADPWSTDTAIPSARAVYEPGGIIRLKGSPMRPESPPPQPALTA